MYGSIDEEPTPKPKLGRKAAAAAAAVVAGLALVAVVHVSGVKFEATPLLYNAFSPDPNTIGLCHATSAKTSTCVTKAQCASYMSSVAFTANNRQDSYSWQAMNPCDVNAPTGETDTMPDSFMKGFNMPQMQVAPPARPSFLGGFANGLPKGTAVHGKPSYDGPRHVIGDSGSTTFNPVVTGNNVVESENGKDLVWNAGTWPGKGDTMGPNDVNSATIEAADQMRAQAQDHNGFFRSAQPDGMAGEIGQGLAPAAGPRTGCGNTWQACMFYETKESCYRQYPHCAPAGFVPDPTTPKPTPMPSAAANPVVPAPPGTCADSTTWHKNKNTAANCEWVAGYTAVRCNAKGAGGVMAFEECKETCGSCTRQCIDSETWHKDTDAAKTCTWAKRFINRCAMPGADGTFGFESCAFACASCNPALGL